MTHENIPLTNDKVLERTEENEDSSIIQEQVATEPEVVLIRVPDGTKYDHRYVMRCGSKSLEVDTEEHPDFLEACTYLQTVSGEKRISGETTALYKKVKELLQEIATTQNKAVFYEFITKYPQLAAWASITGTEIFEWDYVDVLEKFGEEGELLNDFNVFKAQRNFFPTKDS